MEKANGRKEEFQVASTAFHSLKDGCYWLGTNQSKLCPWFAMRSGVHNMRPYRAARSADDIEQKPRASEKEARDSPALSSASRRPLLPLTYRRSRVSAVVGSSDRTEENVEGRTIGNDPRAGQTSGPIWPHKMTISAPRYHHSEL